MSKTIEVKSERFYSAHHALLRIARDSLGKATRKERGWSDNEFVAITLSALAIEAFCNAVGERAIKDWKDFESCSPTAKVRIICTSLGIEYDGSGEPWVTLRWLSKFRNLIAHPKAEQVAESTIIPEHEHRDGEPRAAPKSKLEKHVTLSHAKKAVDSVDMTIDLFCEKLSSEDKFGISRDMWLTSSRLHDSG